MAVVVVVLGGAGPWLPCELGAVEVAVASSRPSVNCAGTALAGVLEVSCDGGRAACALSRVSTCKDGSAAPPASLPVPAPPTVDMGGGTSPVTDDLGVDIPCVGPA